MIYHINRKEMTKEECTRFHHKWDNQKKQRHERAKENMNNRREPEDHEEVMGGNHHNDGDSPHEGIVATLHFPNRQPAGQATMKNKSPSVLPHFHGNAIEDLNEFLFKFDIHGHSYNYTSSK